MVYIILGKGFEPMEAIAPCDILRRGGAEVRFAGIGGTLIEGGHGISVQADCTVEQMKLADTDMVLLPGGLGGVHSILASETAMNFIRLAYEKNYLIAAICAAPDHPRVAPHHRRPQSDLLPRSGRSDGRGKDDPLRRSAGRERHHRPRSPALPTNSRAACGRSKGEDTARQVASDIVYRV